MLFPFLLYFFFIESENNIPLPIYLHIDPLGCDHIARQICLTNDHHFH